MQDYVLSKTPLDQQLVGQKFGDYLIISSNKWRKKSRTYVEVECPHTKDLVLLDNINQTYCGCTGMIKEYISKTLFETIPSYLMYKLTSCAYAVGLLPSSQNIHQEKADVYDLVDAGPRQRFTVLGNTPMIVHNCQSVGHDAHVLFQVLTAETLTTQGLDWYPWHMDLHDCLIFAVRKGQAERAVDLLKDSVYPQLNHILGGEIPLKGEPNVCINWADDKDETYDWKTNEKTQAYIRSQNFSK